MRKLYNFLCSILIGIFLISPYTVLAQEQWRIPKKMLSEEIYFLDLDQDGIKEKVYYDSSNGKIKLWINDKLQSIPIQVKKDECISFYYIDIDKKDKNLELLISISKRSELTTSTSKIKIIRYSQGKIQILKGELRGEIRNWDDENSTINMKVNKKNEIFVEDKDLFYMPALGYQDILVPYYIEKNEVKRKQVQSYIFEYGCGIDRTLLENRHYILNKKTSVYRIPNSKSKVLRKLNLGEVVEVLKLKPNNLEKMEKKNKIAALQGTLSENRYERITVDGYAYIQDKTGRKGWIYLNREYPQSYYYPYNPKATFTWVFVGE